MTSTCYSQISHPEKRPFNVSLFDGLGGVNVTPIPAVDVHYKGGGLRLAPMPGGITGGLNWEIMRISEVFYNWYWIASACYGIGKEKSYFGPKKDADVKRGFLLSGVKVYFGKRFYSQFELGVIREAYKYRDISQLKYSPYYEFGLGINLFPSYKPMPEE